MAGCAPRALPIFGIDYLNVVNYTGAILGRAKIGKRVAIIGAGGIGFDVSELITHACVSAPLDIGVFAKEWGIDFEKHPRGASPA